jgi:hypothetical protein
MKTIAVLVLAVFVIWTAFNRERIFVRDPIASVYRNNVKQEGIEVYLNFSNDIVMQKRSDPPSSPTIVQHWDQAPAIPVGLACLHWLACLTPADHSPVLPSSPNEKTSQTPLAQMNGRHIQYVDGTGAHIRVEL